MVDQTSEEAKKADFPSSCLNLQWVKTKAMQCEEHQATPPNKKRNVWKKYNHQKPQPEDMVHRWT
eukprot:12591891-Prorocentrum_lima.AAC.1